MLHCTALHSDVVVVYETAAESEWAIRSGRIWFLRCGKLRGITESYICESVLDTCTSSNPLLSPLSIQEPSCGVLKRAEDIFCEIIWSMLEQRGWCRCVWMRFSVHPLTTHGSHFLPHFWLRRTVYKIVGLFIAIHRLRHDRRAADWWAFHMIHVRDQMVFYTQIVLVNFVGAQFV